MQPQWHHTRGRNHDDPLHPSDTDLHGGETKSAMKKVKEKVEKLKDTIKHGHGVHGGEQHRDEAENVNNSPVVRSGLAEPTVMGTPVLAEDMYATHSDILDPPVRSFEQWEEEERHGDPPPLSTGLYGTHLTDLPHHHHDYGQDVNREQSRDIVGKSTALDEDPSAIQPTSTVSPANRRSGLADPVSTDPSVGSFALLEEERHGTPSPPSAGIYETQPTNKSGVGDHAYSQDENMKQLSGKIGKSSGMEEDPSAPNPTTAVSPANYQSKVTDPTSTGGKEVGITEVLRSFNKMGVYDEPDPKSIKPEQDDPNVYAGSHDQFLPEPVKNPPLDTIAGDPSHPNSSYKQKVSSATSAIADKAVAAKDLIVSKLSSSGENKGEIKSSSSPADYAHNVADTVTGTLGPIYERVVGAGSSVMSKMQGSGDDDNTGTPVTTRVPERTVKEFLVETFKPGDDDKVLSETITNAFHRRKGNAARQEITSTTYVIRDEGEGERRLQESGN